MRKDASRNASRQWMRLTCKLGQLPEPSAVHAASNCVREQESRLARQWSEPVFGRWPQVLLKSGGAVTPTWYPVGAGCWELLEGCTHSLTPCSFTLSETTIYHSISDTCHFPPHSEVFCLLQQSLGDSLQEMIQTPAKLIQTHFPIITESYVEKNSLLETVIQRKHPENYVGAWFTYSDLYNMHHFNAQSQIL